MAERVVSKVDVGNEAKNSHEPRSKNSPNLRWKLDSDLETRKRSRSEGPLESTQRASRVALPGDVPQDQWASYTQGWRQLCSDLQVAERSHSQSTMQGEPIALSANSQKIDIPNLTHQEAFSTNSSKPTRQRPEGSLLLYSSIHTRHGCIPRRSSKPLKDSVAMPQEDCCGSKPRSIGTTPPDESELESEACQHDLGRTRERPVDLMQEYVPAQGVISSVVSNRGRRNVGRNTKHTSTPPSMASLSRGVPASAAVTRTDVHVVSNALRSPKFANLQSKQANKLDSDGPDTPTMQRTESSDSRYKDVWDGVRPQNNARVQRLMSSVDQVLVSLPTDTKSFECINTKSGEWSTLKDTPFDFPQPNVLVFPDKGSRSADDDETAGESQISRDFARLYSESESARVSQTTSRGESSGAAYFHSSSIRDTASSSENPQLDSDPEAWSARLIAAREQLGMASSDRRLQEAEDAELSFRTHRDSILLAKTRLIAADRARPELLAHRDSVMLAKKRLHVRNQATSASASRC